ncbi:hypothetical protein SAMN05443377_11463 [Propionibacterium cyclohexanicum]|uniref:Sodium:proton antiporter n=1 Tax=Propionibacterium cyclohexanicum TaxID=64702 RepID=A0A1H9SP59_9ACTN|nr:DUF6328 family protein [Propionibacterium cyclohexanicum]SER86697.1 hypothetical protein SAMN05443377_11463 [Propionibacterium cyclohexanicum]
MSNGSHSHQAKREDSGTGEPVPADRELVRPERSETPAERLDRNWSELLQELRVSQTGIQILSAFLLTLPFQSRFDELRPPLTWVFLSAAMMATLSTALIMAPVMAHRLTFRRHAKDDLVRFGNVLAKTGLVTLALTVVLVIVLIVGFVIDVTAGAIAGACCLICFTVLWALLPARLVRTSPTERYR